MQEQTYLSFGPFRLDGRNEQLWRGQEVVHLTNKALLVLQYLLEQRGQLVTKEELFDAVWAGVVVGDSALVVCIRELRQALGDERRTPQFIETVHGRGYRFIGKVVSSQDSVVSRPEQSTNELSLASSVQSLESKTSEGASQSEHIPDVSFGQTLDPQPQTPDAAALSPQRSWSVRSLVIMSLVLLVGVTMLVQYLSLPLPSTPPSIPNPQPALPIPDKPSIVVLPFTNLSGDSTQDYFSDGITEEITARLARVSSLFVIARTSAFTYKGKGVKVQDISRELGVRYVVEGSARKAEEHVRVIAQLIDATTGEHLWAEHYNRPLKGIFAVQDEIVQAVVTALKVKLTPEEQKIFSYAPTESLEAYDYMLRGWQYYMSLTLEANVQARQMFEKAIELDPRYAGAYSSLAMTYATEWIFQKNQDPQIRERAFTLVQKAITLDDSAPGVHEVLGNLHLWLNKQHEQAIAEGERSIALGPNCASCYGSLGITLIHAGRPADAIAFLEKAMRLDPLSGMKAICLTSLGQAYRMMGKYEEAISPLRKALTFNPDFWNAHLQLAATYSELDREQEAQVEVAEVVRTNPQMSLEVLKRMSVQKDQAFLERTIAALRKAGLK